MTKQTQMIGIQGKRRTTRKKVEAGIGTGGSLRLAFPSYTYHAEPGFAEHDMEEYNRICAELAWSRSLATARKAFGIDPDLELVLENHIQSESHSRTDRSYCIVSNSTPQASSSPTIRNKLWQHIRNTKCLTLPTSLR